MKQHPIPQDITNYRFHLIGSMTLKQFGEVAGGVVLGVVVYSTNLIDIVKWPLILLCVAFGAALAWVPIEERPLDHWIITFFKKIYKPTKFYWRKQNKVPDFFNYKAHDPNSVSFAPDVDYTPARRSRIQEYLSSISQGEEQKDGWDQAQDQRAQAMLDSFDQVTVKSKDLSIEEAEKPSKPQLKTRVRKLNTPNKTTVFEKSEASAPVRESVSIQTTPTQSAPTLEESPPIKSPVEMETIEPTIEPTPEPAPETADPEPTPAPTEPAPSKATPSEAAPTIQAPAFETPAIKIKAEKPNQLVGVVRDAQNKNLSGALVEVLSQKNQQTMRIVKTNALGQFRINTALPDGDYLIKSEYGELSFNPLELKLKGKIVPAINIVAS